MNSYQQYLQSIKNKVESNRTTCLIQIGSNVGDEYIFNLIYNKKINLCIFIDANVKALEECRKNISEFISTKKIDWDIEYEYINCAISDIKSPELELNIPTGNDVSAHGSIYNKFPTISDHEHGYETIKVQNFTISDIFNQYNLSIIDYLFIDVEGCDKGIVNSIDWKNNCVLNIKFEFSHWDGWQGYDSDNLRRTIFMLMMDKYKVYQSSATDISATKILDWTEDYNDNKERQ